MKKGKIYAIIVAVLLAVSLIPTLAFASSENENVIKITNSDELIAAINAQQDGQTWVLSSGEYDIKDGAVEHTANIAGVEKGFVFPIHANGLTIKGEGDVTITSSYKVSKNQGGAWSKQNFITVGSSDVTIENVKIKGNYNEYYDGCNKVLELAGNGKNMTLKNVEFLALEDSDGKKSSGSVYLNVADAGKTVFSDVKMASWISARAVKEGTVEINNVTQDFTNNVYAGYYSEQYGYAWNPGVSGEKVSINGFTIQVDGKAEFVQQIMKGLRPGTTIELMDDIKVSEEVYINGIDNITVKGNGHTITAADDFKVNAFGQKNLFKIEADNVSLDNVKLVATDANKHVLDIFSSKNVSLNNVSLNHEKASSGAPMVINSSEVSVFGELELVTGDKSWYAVNIDNKYGDVSLTFEEDSQIAFEDNSSSKDKVLLIAEKSDEDGKDPVVESNSDKVHFDKDENGVINMHTKHDSSVIKNQKEATCTQEGYTGDKVCSVCGEVMEKGQVIPKAEHVFEDGKCVVCGLQEETAAPEEDKDNETVGEEEIPQAGDESMALAAFGAMAVSAAAVFVLKRKKKTF